MSEGSGSYRKPGRKPIWCAGCGMYGIHTSMLKAFARLELDRDRTVLVSGIGCSSRLPFFVDTYGFHSVHGRALPTAVGLKVSRPELTVLVAGGDGDGLSIGGNHFIHAARRNPDITYVMSNNAVYGMTKGQLSPTSPYGMKSSSTPLGSFEYPLNPAALAIVSGATFVARGFPTRAAELESLIAEGISHPGFAFIEVLSPCVTFNKSVGYESLSARIGDIPAGHLEAVETEALALALSEEPIRCGRLYRILKPTYHQRMDDLYGRQCVQAKDFFHHVMSSLSL